MARLLIVDDEQPIADGLAEIIISWDDLDLQEVRVAYGGPEALELMADFPIDFLLTDIHMPVMNGLELIQQTRTSHPEVKCILLSGYSEFEYARQAVQLQAIEYLLKPVRLDTLKSTLKKTVTEWRQHLATSLSYQRAANTLKEHLPELRERFLSDILQGIRFSKFQFEKKLELLELPFTYNAPVNLMIIRMEEEFSRYNPHDLWLMEYALYNIVSEVLEARFHLWHTKDEYGYHVYILSPIKNHNLEKTGNLEQCSLEELGASIQSHIKEHLKGRVSILFSQQDLFPTNLASLYELAVSSLLQKVATEEKLILSLPAKGSASIIHSLHALHEPPSLIHLMLHGKWMEMEEKLHRIFEELTAQWGDSQEHLLEAYHSIYQAYLFIAHKNGKLLADLCGTDVVRTFHSNPFLSVKQLEEWSLNTLNQMIHHLAVELNDSRSGMIRKVQAFIQHNLSLDVSLQRIAEHVYLHPSSLSKIYRTETSESISDYIFRVRMDTAERLLLQSRHKVQDVSIACGYQSTPYFIKVFREYSGVTPQEFRNTVINKAYT